MSDFGKPSITSLLVKLPAVDVSLTKPLCLQAFELQKRVWQLARAACTVAAVGIAPPRVVGRRPNSGGFRLTTTSVGAFVRPSVYLVSRRSRNTLGLGRASVWEFSV
jgi:hypothetical protein